MKEKKSQRLSHNKQIQEFIKVFKVMMIFVSLTRKSSGQ